MNTTGTNSLFVIEDAVRDGALEAWNASPFVKALQAGAVDSTINTKLDENHMMVTTWLGQNNLAFSSVLEYSTPRGSVKLRAVLPSWRAAANAAPGSKALRWSGIHDSGGAPWGPTKAGVSPTYFQGGAGNREYVTNILGSNPINCPPGTAGTCVSVRLDGQPGMQGPTAFDLINDNKTRKAGYGYLTDIAAGDVMCAPLDNNLNKYCINYVANGRFEHLKVVTVSTDSDGTLLLTLQRNIGGTATMPLTTLQQLFMMPSFCGYDNGYGCSLPGTVWDWTTNNVEYVSTGGESHQFTAYDAANQQVLNATNGSYIFADPLCYARSGNYSSCYSVFGGKLDPAKTVNSQLASTFSGLVTMNPPFGVGTATQGWTGIGDGNSVDSHPGAHQLGAAPNSEKVWFVDGRPFNGIDGGFPPPLKVATDVYRFAAADGAAPSIVDVYKRLPLVASCGMNALREVTQLSAQTPYTYCVALNPGDCQSGSAAGDAYVSCPSVRPATRSSACPWAGVARYTPEVRDTCLVTTGAYTMGLTQVGFASQTNGTWSLLPADRRLRSTRLLTRGLSRYRIVDQFWNPKTTPDGAVLLFRSLFVGGYATRFLMAKIPPLPRPAAGPVGSPGLSSHAGRHRPRSRRHNLGQSTVRL